VRGAKVVLEDLESLSDYTKHKDLSCKAHTTLRLMEQILVRESGHLLIEANSTTAHEKPVY